MSLGRALLRSLVSAALILGSCSSESDASGALAQRSGAYLTLVEAPPYPIDRLAPEPVAQTRERRRRLFEDPAEERELPMLRRLKREETGNFGGVAWRWRDGPENGGLGTLTGVAYFLRAPEATLARYTRSPLYRAARGDFARTDQERVARAWADRIGRDVATEGFGNAQVPWLDVALPRAEFERLVRAKGWRLPSNLEIKLNPDAEPDLPAVPADLQPFIRAFPQQRRLAGPTIDIGTVDAVVLRDGCFRIDGPGLDDPVIEFPLGVGVYRDSEGHLAFRPRYSHDTRRLGRVGTRLQLGYRSQRPAPPEIAKACGAGMLVTVKTVYQAAGYGSGWSAVEQFRKRELLSTAEALRRANACLLAQERVLADNRLRGGRGQPARCPELEMTPPPPPPPTPTSGANR